MQNDVSTLATTTDGLTALLDTLSLRGIAVYRGRYTEPWGLSFAPQQEAEEAHATFHMVLRGAGCSIRLDDGMLLPLCVGDFVLLPHADPHVLTKGTQTPIPIELAAARGTMTADGWLTFGGSGGETEILCGNFYFASEVRDLPRPLTHPLLRALPSLILLRGNNGKPLPWLPATIDFLRSETTSGHPGFQTIVNRLAEILFIQAVRSHLIDSDLACPQGNYLRAIADGRVAPALLAIHTRPAEPWSVATLAAHCCSSRSAFAQNFVAQVGSAPLTYLTQWRLFLTGRYLRDTERLTLSEIAERVGYGSEAALSKVFKQHIGITPGEYRKKNAFL